MHNSKITFYCYTHFKTRKNQQHQKLCQMINIVTSQYVCVCYVSPSPNCEYNIYSMHKKKNTKQKTYLYSKLQITDSNFKFFLFSQGTKMELPLWLSKGLYEKKRKVLAVDLPKVYREGWRTVFNADPNVVDLHKMGPYYYGLGSQMLHFDSPENPEIGQTLLQVNNIHKLTSVCLKVKKKKLGTEKRHAVLHAKVVTKRP